MDKLYFISNCNDGSCCCISHRSTAFLISVISLAASAADSWIENKHQCDSKWNQHVDSFKKLLNKLYQMANIQLLFVFIFKNPTLIQLYICYTMAFVVMGLVVALADFLHKFQSEGASSLYLFIVEAVFLFVIFRCLPVVDSYRKHLIKFPYT